MSVTLRNRLASPVTWIIVGTLARFAFILSMGDRVYFGDTAEYEAFALRLLDGLGPSSSSPRAPLFPLEMTAGFALGGRGNYFAVRLIQLAIAAALQYAVMRIAARMGGRAAGAIAGMILAFAPTLVFSTGMLYPTLLYAALLFGVTAAALSLEKRFRIPVAGAMGLCAALAYLTDPVVLAPVGALLVWLGVTMRHRAREFASALAAFAIIAAIVLVPYMSWQRAAYGGKAVFMQKAQYVLHYSRTDSTVSRDRQVKLPYDTPYVPRATGDFVKHEWQVFRAQPAAYAHDVIWEFVHFFRPLPDRIQTRNLYNRGPVLMLGAIYFTPVLALAILGLALGAAPARKRWALAIVVLATGAFYALFFTQTRYRIPVEPMLIILAALGTLRLAPWLARAFDDPAPAGTEGAAAPRA